MSARLVERVAELEHELNTVRSRALAAEERAQRNCDGLT
jgi:outer membrane murein-binding lipoprotein Lpp